MIHEIIVTIQAEVTVPRVIVAIIFGSIVRITFWVLNMARSDLHKFRKRLEKQHRKHGHGAAFDDCLEGNCQMVEPRSIGRLQKLRRAA